MPCSNREWWQSISILSPFVHAEVRYRPIGLPLHREAISLRLWMPLRVHTVLRSAALANGSALARNAGNPRPTLNTRVHLEACYASENPGHSDYAFRN